MQPRKLDRNGLVAFAKLAANQPENETAKAVLEIAQADDDKLINGTVYTDNQDEIIKVLSRTPHKLIKADGNLIADGELTLDNIDDNIKSDAKVAQATKKAICEYRDLLLATHIEKLETNPQKLIAMAQANDARAMGEAWHDLNPNPYRINVKEDAFTSPPNQGEGWQTLKTVAQEQIVKNLAHKLQELKEDKLDKLIAVINEGPPVKDLDRQRLVEALNAAEIKGVANIDANTLTEDHFKYLLKEAQKQAKDLVQDKLKALPGAIADLKADEAKNAFAAAVLLRAGGTAAELKANAVNLKLTAFNADRLGTFPALVYTGDEIKKDARQAMTGIMTRVIKETDHFNTEDKVQSLRNIFLDDKKSAQQKAMEINALLPFQAWGGGLNEHDLTPEFVNQLKTALDQRSQAIKYAQSVNEFKTSIDALSRVDQPLYGGRINLKNFLLHHDSDIVKKLTEGGVKVDKKEEVEAVLQDILTSMDTLSVRKALIAIGVPEDTQGLDDIAKATADRNQVKVKTASKEEAKKAFGRDKSLLLEPDAVVLTSCWRHVSRFTSATYGKLAPEGDWGDAKDAAGKAKYAAKGLQTGVAGVAGAAAFVGSGVVMGLVTLFEAGNWIRTYATSSIKQHRVVRNFDEIDMSLAQLQHEIEKAKGSKDPEIQKVLTDKTNEILAELQEAKETYDKDKDSFVANSNRLLSRYKRLSSGCDARIQQITNKLQPQLLDLKTSPEKYQYITRVEVVELNNADQIAQQAQKLFGRGGIAELAEPEIRFGGAGKEISKDDFKDAKKGTLVKLEIFSSVGQRIDSCALTTVDEKTQLARTKVYNPDEKDGKPLDRNPFIGMDRHDMRVIQWAVQMVTAQLQKAKNKSGINISPGAGDRALTKEQIAAVFIYCSRLGITCGPKDLYDVPDKTMKTEKAKQLETIEKYFKTRDGDILKAGGDNPDPGQLERRLDVLAERAKYKGKDEVVKFLEDASGAKIKGPRM